MRNIFVLLAAVIAISSTGLSMDFQASDRTQWEKGEFNGTFYNSSEGLTMGYHNSTSDGLDTLWRFEENVSGNGGEFTGYSQNGYGAVAYNGVNTTAPGVLSSSAVNLDGSDDYLALRKKYTSSGEIDQITVCSWVKSTDAETGYGNFIASFDRSEYWRFSFDDDSSSGSHIAWDTTDSSGNTHDLATSKSYADGKWHYACGWYDSDAATSKKIFVDGIQVASASAHGGNSLGTGATRYGFIGTGSEASSFNGDQGGSSVDTRFNGTIDEFRIHQRALSDQEINSSYFNGLEGFFNSSYSRRYSENTLLNSDSDWRKGEFNSTESLDSNLGLQKLSDVKIGSLTAASGDWMEINYSNFESPVVVATVENTGNGNGLISEVRNVGQSSASIRVCDSDGRGSCQASSGHIIHYIAVDASSVNSVDGIEAGTFDISGEFTSTANTVNYQESFSSAPVPFTTVQTVQGTPGVEARISSHGSGSFTGGICQQDSQDACNGGHTTETVGWIAIEPGNSPIPNSELGTTGTVVSDSNWNTQSYSSLENPVGLVSGLSENGGQELQIDEVRNIQSTSMDVRYCEIESGNSCDTHTEENLGWMAVEPGEYSLSSTLGYNTSGSYSSKIYDAGRQVYLKKAFLDYQRPQGTDFNINYGVNSSGQWVYSDQFPENNLSRYFRFNVSFLGDGDNTSRINSLDIVYSDSQDKAKWRSLTTDAKIRDNTSLNATVKALNYSGEVLGTDKVLLIEGEQSYSVDLPESEDVTVEFHGGTSNISRSWALNSFTLSTDPDSICDHVTETECVLNSTREFTASEYQISRLFISRPQADLESLNGKLFFNVSQNAEISGSWTGSFRIKSDSLRIKAGARFRPVNGVIEIGR
ncbi:LamG domain-containing protein [Candidatus Nanosalina sp. VS9-1]|uniref:LamG domain-containing protein n=1 Tax=Candidatus Nanosalina sp. VS9-1 TaxID=3388566 RepID=UPI0039E1D1D9